MKYVAINSEDAEGIFCFGDLYKKLGIAEFSEKCGGFIRSVEQIRANKKTIEYLHNLFVTNVKSSKDKRVKHYRKEYRKRLVAWDFVMWAPATDDTIPDMQIGLEEDKEKYDKLS